MLFNQTRQPILIISLISAAILWLGESLFHFAILDYGQPFELIPSDINELWMRAVICSLIVIFGMYVQRQVNKKLELEEEKMRTLRATMHTVQDRVGNSLCGIKLLLGGPEGKSLADKETHQKLTTLIDETFENLRKISNIEEINEKKFSKGSYYMEIENK